MPASVNVVPGDLTTASADLTSIGSGIREANTTAAAATTEISPAGLDEVSAAIAAFFDGYAQQYQVLGEQATQFHDQFTRRLTSSGDTYTNAESASTLSLQAADQNETLQFINALGYAFVGHPLIGDGLDGAPRTGQAGGHAGLLLGNGGNGGSGAPGGDGGCGGDAGLLLGDGGRGGDGGTGLPVATTNASGTRTIRLDQATVSAGNGGCGGNAFLVGDGGRGGDGGAGGDAVFPGRYSHGNGGNGGPGGIGGLLAGNGGAGGDGGAGGKAIWGAGSSGDGGNGGAGGAAPGPSSRGGYGGNGGDADSPGGNGNGGNGGTGNTGGIGGDAGSGTGINGAEGADGDRNVVRAAATNAAH